MNIYDKGSSVEKDIHFTKGSEMLRHLQGCVISDQVAIEAANILPGLKGGHACCKGHLTVLETKRET